MIEKLVELEMFSLVEEVWEVELEMPSLVEVLMLKMKDP